MFLYTLLFLLGLMFVRLSSIAVTTMDPLDLLATYAAKRNFNKTEINSYNYTYFHIMCSFYATLFAICYLGLNLPSTRKIKSLQGIIDSSFTFLVLFGLQISFVFARYTSLMVVIGSFTGALWAILMINIAKCIAMIGVDDEVHIIVEPCINCCKKRDGTEFVYPVITATDIFVY